MKQFLISALLAASILTGCMPSTVITATWKAPIVPDKKISRVLVAALTSNTIAKETVENDIATALNVNITALKSIDEFPPEISNSDTSKTEIMNRVKNKNIDAILTVSLINKETESRYIPGHSPYNPLNGFGYYDSFWGYYSYWYPYTYNQGYYIQEKVYFIETNVYSVPSGKLIWSAQSKTYDPHNLKTFSKEFATIITTKLKKDGIIMEKPNTEISQQ
jgi:hypothetical protein